MLSLQTPVERKLLPCQTRASLDGARAKGLLNTGLSTSPAPRGQSRPSAGHLLGHVHRPVSTHIHQSPQCSQKREVSGGRIGFVPATEQSCLSAIQLRALPWIPWLLITHVHCTEDRFRAAQRRQRAGLRPPEQKGRNGVQSWFCPRAPTALFLVKQARQLKGVRLPLACPPGWLESNQMATK